MAENFHQRQTWKAGRAILGVILIFLGIVYVGVFIGIFDWTVWTNVWRLWPLIVVGIGLSLLLPRKVVRFGTVLVVAILAVVGLWLLWRQSTFTQSGSIDSQDVAVALTEGINRSQLSVRLPAASVQISGPADTDKVATGYIETKGIEHEFVTHKEGEKESLSISATGTNTPFMGAKGRIDLQLSGKVTHAMDIDIGRSDIRLDLTSLPVERVDITGGSSTIDMQFGTTREMTEVDIRAGASSISFSAPEAAGVRVEFASGLSSTSLEGLSSVSDNVYQSENYDEAENKILIDIESGVSSVVFAYR